MSTPQDALRARQGPGARYDAKNAPHKDLLNARRSIAGFARYLNDLPDDLLPQVARTIAHVSYTARGLAEAIEAVRAGNSPPETHLELADRTASGATLPPRALRSLFRHATQHLSVEWRDLGTEGWTKQLTFPGGDLCSVEDTPRLIAEVFNQSALQLHLAGNTPEDRAGEAQS